MLRLVLLMLLLCLAGCANPISSISSGTPPPPSGPDSATVAPIYGNGMQAFPNGLENLRVGVDMSAQDNRFRAEQTGNIQSIILFIKAGSGYSGGSGGTINLSFQTDDGTANHFPSGTELASTSAATGNRSTVGFRFTFANPPAVVAGTLYHVVITNADSSPTSNYISIDNMANQDSSPQPYYSLTDWSANWKPGGSWVAKPDTCPIMAIAYANGMQGMGYVEAAAQSGLVILAGGAEVGENFTVSGGDKTVNAINVHIAKSGSPAPLTVTLQSGSTTLVTGTIPASSFTSLGSWGTLTFPATVLNNGSAYHLSISCSSCNSGNAYQAFPMGKGLSDGYQVASTFQDGNYESNGSVRSGWDMQFYFTKSAE